MGPSPSSSNGLLSGTSTSPGVNSDISAALHSKGLHPQAEWLANFIGSQRPSIPLPALAKSALARLVHTDFTTSLQRTPRSTFPADILSQSLPPPHERRLQGPVPVQVLDMQDVGRSRWSQIEAVEAQERGETTRGREIVRVVPGERDDDAEEGRASARARRGPHKLLLQDANGATAHGFEVKTIQGIDTDMAIGTKLVLRNAVVARGMVLMNPDCVAVLGGKLDDRNRVWRERRKETLKQAALVASRETT